MSKSQKPQTKTVWTPEQDRLLAEVYPTGGAEAALKVIVGKTEQAIRSRARNRGICLTKEARSRIKSLAISRQQRSFTANTVARKPFDDVPDEFVKVSSIWRVGQRYAAQEDLCEA